MARWNTLFDDELDARTIYTGAYGWRDNDALGRVWARTPREFERIMRSTLHDEAKRAYADEWQAPIEYRKSFGELKDSLWYVGPYAETVGQVIADMEETRRADEMRDDIRTSSAGYVY